MFYFIIVYPRESLSVKTVNHEKHANKVLREQYFCF